MNVCRESTIDRGGILLEYICIHIYMCVYVFALVEYIVDWLQLKYFSSRIYIYLINILPIRLSEVYNI